MRQRADLASPIRVAADRRAHRRHRDLVRVRSRRALSGIRTHAERRVVDRCRARSGGPRRLAPSRGSPSVPRPSVRALPPAWVWKAPTTRPGTTSCSRRAGSFGPVPGTSSSSRYAGGGRDSASGDCRALFGRTRLRAGASYRSRRTRPGRRRGRRRCRARATEALPYNRGRGARTRARESRRSGRRGRRAGIVPDRRSAAGLWSCSGGRSRSARADSDP